MKLKSVLIGLLAISVLFSLNSCSPKTKKVTIDNTMGLLIDGGLGIRPVPNGEPGQNEFYNIQYNLLWDVEVALNGVDFGVVKGGTESGTLDVPDANNLKVEKFNILKNEQGLSVYYMIDTVKYYVDFNVEPYTKVEGLKNCEQDMKAMEDKFKKVEQAGGLLNDSWKWNISYGDNGNIMVNQQREEEAKKKK